MSTLLDGTLSEQAAAVAGGDAGPAELLDAALARIEERNPSVNAIVETFPDSSRRMLDEAPRGPLYGVPIAIKDEWPLPWRAERLGAAESHVGAGEAGLQRLHERLRGIHRRDALRPDQFDEPAGARTRPGADVDD